MLSENFCDIILRFSYLYKVLRKKLAFCQRCGSMDKLDLLAYPPNAFGRLLIFFAENHRLIIT